MTRAMTARAFCVLSLVAGLTALSIAGAQAATLTRTLRDLGFSTGLQLRFDESAGIFLRIPQGAALEGVELETYGSGTAAGLAAASVHWSVNGVPVDAVAIRPGNGRWTLGRQASIRASGPNGSSALPSDARGVDVRYAVDLRKDVLECQYDRDPNALAIAPNSRIRLNLDVSGVDTLSGALDLLPSVAPIVLPAGGRLSDTAFAAALRVALAVKNSGREPSFVERRPADALVALHIVSDRGSSEQSSRSDAASDAGPSRPRLIRPSAERFDILIDDRADIGDFLRLWDRDLNLLSDDVAPSWVAEEGETARSVLGFERLPAAIEIGRRGEWLLPFDMSTEDGRLPSDVELALRVAPDWSDEQPILTVFLNGQIIDAARLRTDVANALSIALPATLLQQDNVLRLVVDRAPQPGRCLRPGEGLYGQLLQGTRLRLGTRAADGFAAVAHNLDDGDGYRIRVPEGALERPAAIEALTFLGDVLAGLNADGSETLVVKAGPPASPAEALDDLALEVSDPDGLTVELSRNAALSGTLSFDAGAPLAAATADGNRLRLTVPETLSGYDTTQFDLRAGDRALLGTQGVVWQNGPEGGADALRRPIDDLIDRLRAAASQFGAVFLLWMAGIVLVVVLARRVIVRRAVRKRAVLSVERTGG